MTTDDRPMTSPALRLPVLLHNIPPVPAHNHGECGSDHGAEAILAALGSDGWAVVPVAPGTRPSTDDPTPRPTPDAAWESLRSDLVHDADGLPSRVPAILALHRPAIEEAALRAALLEAADDTD